MTDSKPSNPKDRIGILKAAMGVVPMRPLFIAALAHLEGALKYGRHNWRKADVRSSVYHDAIHRHLAAWWEGEDRASDSKVEHLGHIMACCAILLDAEHVGKLEDDRPPRLPVGWQAELNARAKEMVERYPDPVEPYTQERMDAENTPERIEASRDAEGMTAEEMKYVFVPKADYPWKPKPIVLKGDKCDCKKCDPEPTVRIQGGDVPASLLDKPKGWNALYGDGAGYGGEDRFELYDPARAKRQTAEQDRAWYTGRGDR